MVLIAMDHPTAAFRQFAVDTGSSPAPSLPDLARAPSELF
jgi:hypothetical protein